MKTVLHVGCGGQYVPADLFQPEQWIERRLDIDPNVNPDYVYDIRDLPFLALFDAVYSAHNLEHVHAHEVQKALAGFYRALVPGGMVHVSVPDMQLVAQNIAEGNLTRTLYDSPAGQITPLDVLYGHQGAIQSGNGYYAHRTGFVADSLGEALVAAGFIDVAVTREPNLFQLSAHGRKPERAAEPLTFTV